MSVNASGGSTCRSRPHYFERWEIYESLPVEIRDELKMARSNLYAGCIRATLRRQIRTNGGNQAAAISVVVNDLARARRMQKERRGREVVYWYEPEGTGP
jgi:hypothetical protein